MYGEGYTQSGFHFRDTRQLKCQKTDTIQFILSFEDLKLMIKTLPTEWKNDQKTKSDVLFLWDDVDDETLLSQLSIKPGIDTILFVLGAILWIVAKKDSTQSGLVNFVGDKQYKKMTIRNVNSTRKIYSLMKEISDRDAMR